jgi:serine/threonine-protein kinase
MGPPAGSLSHPGIAQVYDYREEDPPDPSYLVMELVDGPSLAALLDEGPVDAARTMGLIAEAAAALQAAHAAGVVHRDIKPGNLLVNQDGAVKITDFGIAHAAGSASLTSPGTLIGTPAYLAPERAAGAPATPATDLYALGIVAYQCLTGRLPFDGEPLAIVLAHLERPVPPLPPSVPAGVAALVADLTAKKPQARPASAGEVANRAQRLRQTLTGSAIGPPDLRVLSPAAPGTDTRTMVAPLPGWRGKRRRRGKPYGRVLAGLALAMTAAIAGAGWVIAGRSAPHSVPPAATQPPGPGAGGHRTHPVVPASRTDGTTGTDAVGQVGAGKSAAHHQPHGSHAAATARHRPRPRHRPRHRRWPEPRRPPGHRRRCSAPPEATS